MSSCHTLDFLRLHGISLASIPRKRGCQRIGSSSVHASAETGLVQQAQLEGKTLRPTAPASPWPPRADGRKAAPAPSRFSPVPPQQPRSTAGRGARSDTQVCRTCNGRRVISAAGGTLPCPACAGWRQRADYQPNRPLLNVQDLDLAALDALDVQRLSSIANGGSSAADSAASRPRRVPPMTEERRRAIQEGMQKRGPLPPDHKRNIARGMRAAHAANPTLRMTGRPKRCGHCGGEGHNRKTCPLLHPDKAAATAAEQLLQSTNAGDYAMHRRKKFYACSVCGQPGHNRVSCPEAGRQRTAGSAQLPTQLIVIEDVEDAPGLEGTPPRDWGSAQLAAELAAPTQYAASSRDGGFVAGLPVGHQPAGEQDTAGGSSAPVKQPTMVSADPAQDPRQVDLPTESSLSLFGTGLSLSDEGGIVFPLPTRREQCVSQAARAVVRAWEDGVRRQNLELLLPQSNAPEDGGWPGGIRQQFRAALPLVEDLLLRLKRVEGLEGRITAEWLDEGDCVAAWQSERLAAVVFPSADSLPEVRRIDDALSGERLLVLVNAQWQPAGNLVSDFGFGRSRRAAERYVDSLEDVYCLRRVRVLGDELRVLRCYPGQWQVHFMHSAARSTLLAVEDSKPTYQRLLELLKGVGGSRASKSWLDRALMPGTREQVSAYEEDPGSEGIGQVAPLTGDKDAAGQRQEGTAEEADLERDIITGEVVRDYRIQPVQQIARWLGGEGGSGKGG